MNILINKLVYYAYVNLGSFVQLCCKRLDVLGILLDYTGIYIRIIRKLKEKK